MALDIIPKQEGGKLKAVASGTLPSGKPVVVNADGTVSVVESRSQSIGSPVTFESGITVYTSTAIDTNSNKVVVVYREDTVLSGVAVVGTVSGSSISFGTPVVFQSNSIAYPAAVFDSNSNKIVIVYEDNGNSQYGTAIVGTVSGTSISFGTPVVFESAQVSYVNSTFDSNSNKVVVSYRDAGNSNYGTAVVGTVSGTSISFGTPVVFESSTSVSYTSPTFDSNSNKIVIAYEDTGNLEYGTAVVGTVSGTSISFGTPVVFETGGVAYVSSAFDSVSNQVIIAYHDDSNSNRGTAIVGSVSGTSISFGTAVAFAGAALGSSHISISFDSTNNIVVIAYRDDTLDDGRFVVGSVSGTSISFGTELQFSSDTPAYMSTAFDVVSGKTIINYRGDPITDIGESVLFQPTSINLTSENYIGTAATGAPDGQGAKINIKGAVADIPTSGFGIDNASYDSVSFSVNSQTTSPYGMVFNTDGTKMYVTSAGFGVYQYSLSTGFDLSTASYDNVSFDATSQNDGISGVAFNSDGTKMYILGYNSPSDQVYQYSLSTGFDISTASYDSVSFSVSQESLPFSIAFNNDGTKMFVSGFSSDTVYQYSLSTGFNLSTASYDNVSFSAQSEESSLYGLAFNNDGTKMFVCGDSSGSVFQYDLSTGFDLSTASYNGVSFDLSSQDTTPREIFFNNDGTKMYVAGDQNDTIFQYSSVSGLTAGQSYYVQTDGTLGTTPADPSVFAGTAVGATKLIVKG